MAINRQRVKTLMLIVFIGALAFTFFSVSTATYATTNSNTVSADVQGVIAIRLLNAAQTTEISELNYDLTPTPPTSHNPSISADTQRVVADVSTSNPTGYKLFMQSDYQTKDSNGDPTGTYTTNLVHTDTEVSDVIPTYVPGSGSGSGTNTLYWNYTNPLTSANTAIPAHGAPHKLAELFETTNSDTTDVDINVSVDTTIVSGTYENQLLFSAIANPSPVDYTITFDADGGSSGPANIETEAESSVYSTIISSTTPTKTGYTFSHWNIEDTGYEVTCTNPSTAAVSTTTCNPGDTIRVYADGEATAEATLKAVYTKNSYTIGLTGSNITIKDATDTNVISSISVPYGESVTFKITPVSGYYLSAHTCASLTGYSCSAISTGISATGTQTITLTNNSSTNTGTITFTGTVAARTIANSTYFQEVTSCPSTLTTGTQYTLTDQGETSKSYTTARLADGKCWMTQNYNRGAGALSSTYYNIGSGRSYSVPSSSTSGWSSDSGNYYYSHSTYGGYYSYYAATAGANPSSGASSYDICPKGWRLPTQTEYNTLISTYSAGSAGSKLVAAPVNMKYGGYCCSSSCPYYAGSGGYYWSSTANSSSNAYLLNFNSSSANTYGNNKRNGFSVRCVFGS